MKTWNALTSKKKREAGDNNKAGNKADPMGGLMDMMKISMTREMMPHVKP